MLSGYFFLSFSTSIFFCLIARRYWQTAAGLFGVCGLGLEEKEELNFGSCGNLQYRL